MSNYQFRSAYLNHRRYEPAINGIPLNAPIWPFHNMPLYNRNVYNPLPSLQQRSVKDCERYRASKSIVVSAFDVLKPVQNFEEVNFHPSVLITLKKAGFTEPTPIQAQSWPIALSGRDMVGVATKGSGKTLAYLLPAISQVLYQRQFIEKKFPLVTILAPTRELAVQIHRVLLDYTRNLPVRAIFIYGGINVNIQLQSIKKDGVDFVVATPGRLLHFISINAICLYFCNYVVIDDADLMLQMGFIPQLNMILSQMRRDRQTLMFSATFSDAARALASQILSNYVHVSVETVNRKILQIVLICEQEERKEMLYHLLKEIQSEKKKQTLLFVNRKKNVLILTEYLKLCRFNVEGFHADMKQVSRGKTLKAFKNGDITTLVTTDDASRELDFEKIRYVINYDFPKAVSVYVHRIGRTARGSKNGTSYTFFTKKDWSLVGGLIQVLKETNNRVPSVLLQGIEPEAVRPKKRRKI